jgi:sugar lactone lactonase YvrE
MLHEKECRNTLDPAIKKKVMRMKTLPTVAAVLVSLALQSEAQTYDTNGAVVQTFAGSGFSGYLDGVGQQTMFNYPNGIVTDSHSNLFVWDSGNLKIRKITPDGTVSTFASGFNYAFHVMGIDKNDTIWIVALYTVLYRITSNGVVTVTNLTLTQPQGICTDSVGNVYISDLTENKIYRYRAGGPREVFVGSGNGGHADGNGVFTSFSSPMTLAADGADNIYVWDSGNRLVRRINQNRDVETIAGRLGVSSDSDGANKCVSLE